MRKVTPMPQVKRYAWVVAYLFGAFDIVLVQIRIVEWLWRQIF